MNLRPLVGNFADPQYKLSRADQNRLTKKAHKEHLSPMKLALVTLAMIVMCILAWSFVHPQMTALLMKMGVLGKVTPNLPLAWLLAAFLFIIAVWIASAWGYRFLYIRPLRMAMREEGYNLCLACGYNLRGQSESTSDHDINQTTCPECGTLSHFLSQGKIDESGAP
ncbi:MAG: hypothetical protein O7G85_13470 [Planctomycetota bacterium]|nr:hypothetical protein [Planctomycetota bacterium]